MKYFFYGIVLLFPYIIFGQEPPDTLKKPLRINEVIVSATRWTENSVEVPSKIITISPENRLLQNPQTAADLLGISGKIFIQKSQQGGGSPMIRGFATNRLLYAIDGIRMNTAIFRGGNIQNVISLDPFSVEKTEVVFGPGSVIYGSDAIGGVMAFRTLEPTFSSAGESSVNGNAITRYASANHEKTGHFDINIGWKKWAIVTSISSFDYGDLLMGSHGPDEYLCPYYVQFANGSDQVFANENKRLQRPTGYDQINFMQKVSFKPSDKWDFQYGFHYSETSSYSRYDRLIRYRNGYPRYAEWYYGPQKWMMNNLKIIHNKENALYNQMSLRMAQQYFEESRISRNINDPLREIRTEKVNAYSINLDFTKSAGGKNNIFYGAEVVWNDVNSQGINEIAYSDTSMPGPSRYPQSIWSSYGVYLSDQYKVNEKFLVQAGLRYSQYSIDADFDTSFYPFPFTTANLNDGALTGSVGFVYRPSDTWVINANAATAFRSPNVDDIGKVFDSEPGSVTVPNPDLKAEYAYNFDLGIVKVLSDIIKIDITGYYTLLQNALVRRNYTLNGMDSIMYDGTLSQVQAMQNAAKANVYGIQAGVEVRLPSGFYLVSDFNYQKGEEELDDGTTSPSRHAPPGFGVSRIGYKTNKLDLQFYAMYSGERKYEDMPEEEKGKPEIYAKDDDGNPYSPSWYTLNFKAMYHFTGNFTVCAGLENITDQRYRPYSSGIVAPGRNFILSLCADF